jgi:hypothetical protein
MGVAPTAMALLPFGAEDDNGAWSRFGGRWHRVRVRYPRGWPPGWGKHPAFAAFLAVLWGVAAVAATGELVRVRRRRQIFQSSNRNNPKYWYYLALDNGTRARIRSWRVRRDIYNAHSQGQSVEAVCSPNLGYVREMRAAGTT